jgi:hypothetical protein
MRLKLRPPQKQLFVIIGLSVFAIFYLQSESVEITLSDNLGKLVYKLKNRTPHDAGIYKITLNGVELNSGIYFCTLRTETEQRTEKLLIVK